MSNREKRRAWTSRRGGSPTVIVAPTERQPLPVDAMVYEEDTYLVLSAEPELSLPGEHPIRVLTEAYGAVPETPGKVVVREGHPLKLLAVVHNLDQDPTWREEWVASALESVFQEAERREVRSMGLPLLGTVHGKMSWERGLEILRQALEKVAPTTLEHLWLIAPPGTGEGWVDRLVGGGLPGMG